MQFSAKLLIIIVVCLIRGTNCVLWPCDNDDDCSIVETATCSPTNLCRCPAGHTFSDDVSKCLKESLYGENCESSNQCSHMLTGSKCNKVCECAEGYTYIRGRCKQLSSLGSTCTDTSDCVFGYDRESVVCHENLCKCSDGYYQRTENICRRKSMNIGDSCVVHEDCHGASLECINLLCKDIKRSSKDIGIQTSFQYVEMKNATTSIDLFGISAEKKETENNGIYGQPCNVNNAPCPELHHSICIQGLCHCMKGYYERNGLCKAEIGEFANSDDLCENTNRDPNTKRCKCDVNRFANSTLRECLKPTDSIGFSCTQNAQCSPFGAAYCSIDRRCQCQSYAIYNEATQLCTPKEGLGSLCHQNDDSSNECAKREPNTVCVNNACACEENFVEIGEHCKPGENAQCSIDSDCAVENLECQQQQSDSRQSDKNQSNSSSLCKCKSGFVPVDGKCFKEVTEYNEECIENDQCKPLLGSMGKCLDGQCGCEDHLQHSNGQCNKKMDLGEECKKSSECFTIAEQENVECRNAVCTCKYGYERDIERQMCRATKKKNSAGRPSVMKVITLLLTSAAVLITSAALKEAYFP